MDFDLPQLLAAHRDDGYELYGRYLNPQQPKVLHAIGFDKVYERAEGAYLYDSAGHQYADFLAGFGVFAAGRNHPVIRQALHDALDAQLADWTQFDCGPLPGLLAEKLIAKAPGLDRVFFCNSGTEAVESALKFARYATGRRRVIYCDHAFHGLTTGSLSINGSAEFRLGFDPLLPDTSVPLGDLDALAAELRRGDVAALIIEPIQGKGVHMPPDGFLTAASALLHEHGALLICDEVQSGLGRTGKFFAYQHEEVVPDIVTVAKALSGGFVPVGAMLAKGWIFEKVYSSMDRVMVHSTTFKGGVLAMAAGLASLAVLDDEGLVENAARTGAALRIGADRDGRTVRRACRRARPRADDRPGVRQAVIASRPDQLEHAAEGPGGLVRADGGGGAVPAAPHPHPGVWRPHGGDQADPAADDRRHRGEAVHRGVRRGSRGRQPGQRADLGVRPHPGEAGGTQLIARPARGLQAPPAA